MSDSITVTREQVAAARLEVDVDRAAGLAPDPLVLLLSQTVPSPTRPILTSA